MITTGVTAGTAGVFTVTSATDTREIDIGNNSATAAANKLALVAAQLTKVSANGTVVGDVAHNAQITISDNFARTDNFTILNNAQVDIGAHATAGTSSTFTTTCWVGTHSGGNFES